MDARGNTILITGGAGGIGLALARRLIVGNTVIVCGRDEDRLAAARASLPGLVAIRADVSDPADRAALAAAIGLEFPDLNVLVNNAAGMSSCGPADAGIAAALEADLATNLVAPAALTAMLLPLMRRAPRATVVNVTTGYVFSPSARAASYSATKTGLRALTRTLRFALRDTAVRVVEVVPPPVDTAMAAGYGGRKMTADRAAALIHAGLLANRNEIVFGVSRLAQVMARLAPELVLAAMNRSEARWPRPSGS